MRPKEAAVKHATIVFVVILVVWGLYRLLVQLPEEVEELFIKPVVWLAPVLYFLNKERANLASVGFTMKRFFPSIYFSLCLGAIFAIEGLIVNYIKYGGSLAFNSTIGEHTIFYMLGLSFATAIPEEVVFRGFVFSRLWMGLKNQWQAIIISSVFWSILHIPIALFLWQMDLVTLLMFILLTFLYGIGAAFIFARTQNIIGPILLHVLWESPIILFR